MSTLQSGVDALRLALNVVDDIKSTIFANSPKKSISWEDLKDAGKDKLSKDMYSFIPKLKNVNSHVNSMITAADTVKKDIENLKAENERLTNYRNILDLIDTQMTDWRDVITGEGASTPRIRSTEVSQEELAKQPFFIGSRSNGKCITCEKMPTKPSDDTLCCEICRNHFHGSCLAVEKEKRVCLPTFLKQYKANSVPTNFKWRCDICSTRFEKEASSTDQSTAATLSEAVNKLSSQMQQIQTNMDTKFSEVNQIFTNTKSNVWSDNRRISSMKSALLIKPDKNGKPVELPVIRDLAIQNGIQVNKTVVTDTGNTFINLPSVSNRDKLAPLLESSSVVEPDRIVNLKSKLPTISVVGIEEAITKDTAAAYILGQNQVIKNLVESGETFHVVFVKKPGEYSKTWTMVARVSPRIRDEIRRLGNKLHIGLSNYQVRDRFYVKRCNNCQFYHHYEDVCKKTKQCGYCRSRDHTSIECPIKNSPLGQHSCCNCESSGKTVYKGHNTMWYRCPTYKEEQAKLKKSINYNYSAQDDLN